MQSQKSIYICFHTTKYSILTKEIQKLFAKGTQKYVIVMAL